MQMQDSLDNSIDEEEFADGIRAGAKRGVSIVSSPRSVIDGEELEMISRMITVNMTKSDGERRGMSRLLGELLGIAEFAKGNGEFYLYQVFIHDISLHNKNSGLDVDIYYQVRVIIRGYNF